MFGTFCLKKNDVKDYFIIEMIVYLMAICYSNVTRMELITSRAGYHSKCTNTSADIIPEFWY